MTADGPKLSVKRVARSANDKDNGRAGHRIILPWQLRHTIRVRVTSSENDKSHEYRLTPPFRVGYSKDCEITLTGGKGPDTLFEFSPSTRPIHLSTLARTEPENVDYRISIDGNPLSSTEFDLNSGSVVNIHDHSGHKQVALTVDMPEGLSNRLLLVYSVLILVLTSVVGYGIYTYQILKRTEHRIGSTEARISRTEIGILQQNERIESILNQFNSRQMAVDQTLQEIGEIHQSALRNYRNEFSEKLRQIAVEAQEALSRLSSEDVQARLALAAQTDMKIDNLRLEVTSKLFDSLEVIKLAQEEVFVRNAQRLESLEVESTRFKTVLTESADAVIFVRTSYTAEVLATGEKNVITSVGTGFIVNNNGLALAPQHVMKPWLYDESFLAMQVLGIIRLLPETVEHTVWTAQQQVLLADEKPLRYLTEHAFVTGNQARNVLILHTPDPDKSPYYVASPFGIVEVSMPVPGPTDIAVFQLMDFTRTFPALLIEQDTTLIEPLDEVLLVGYPLSRLKDGQSIPQAVIGFVRLVTDELLELNSALHPGSSGAPVLNRQAFVIGMAIATLGSDSYGAAIPGKQLAMSLSTAANWVDQVKRQMSDRGCESGMLAGQIDGLLWRSMQSADCAGPAAD